MIMYIVQENRRYELTFYRRTAVGRTTMMTTTGHWLHVFGI